MVDRFRSLGIVAKTSFVLLLLAALIGCYFGGKRLLRQDRSSVVEAERAHADWYTVEITEQGWNPAPWFSSSSAFTGVARIQTRLGFMFVAYGTLRITDQSGNLVRSWAAIKRVRCNRHQNDNDRLTDHSGTVTFDWTWNGKNGNGVQQPDGQYNYTFTVRFRAKQDSEQGTIGIDRTAPSITIEQPQGQIAATDVPVAITWSDSAAGIEASTGSVSIDDTPAAGLTIDASGAHGAASGLAIGQHTIAAIVSDTAGNEASASGLFEVIEEQGEPEQRTSIVGTVADSTGTALPDVAVYSTGATSPVTSGTDGRFLIEVTSGGTHWLTFHKEGYIQVQRPAVVTDGHHVNIGEVRMATADTIVTTIDASGGTAVDSSGDIGLTVPAGALSEAIDFRLTHIPSSSTLPGPLNASDNIERGIAYTFCVMLEPAGVTFASPATLSYPNRWGFPAGHQIPTAFWNHESNRWEPDGSHMVVSADGSKIEKQLGGFPATTSSSPVAGRLTVAANHGNEPPPPPAAALDANHSADTPGAGGGTGSGGPPGNCTASKSTVLLNDSTYIKTISLPAVTAAGVVPPFSFTYRSDTASPFRVMDVVHSFRTNITGLENWKYEIEVNGNRKEVVFSAPSAPDRLVYYWDGRNGRGDLSPTGLYDYTVTTTARYPGYFTNETTWGGVPTALTSAATGEPVEKSRVLKESMALVNGAGSEFGAGWHFSGHRRLYQHSDGRVLVVAGGEEGGIYYPRINYARIAEGAAIAAISNAGRSGDKRNMLGYHGNGVQYYAQHAEVNYQDGFEFNSSGDAWHWVVVDLGAERQVDTLGLDYVTFDTDEALVTYPLIEISTSLDNSTWSLWARAVEEIIEGGRALKVGSPYLASHATSESVRYVKYRIRPPTAFGTGTPWVVYRLYAFGASPDRYGSGPQGGDDTYPKLRRLEATGWEQVDRDGTKHLFDSDGFHTRTEDIHGNATVYTWQDGLLTAITDAAGGVTTFTYSNGKLATVTDAAARATAFTIDGNGDLTSVRMPDGSATQFSYDSRHLVETTTDPRGNLVEYTWDPIYANLKKLRTAGGAEISYESSYFGSLVNELVGTESAPATPISATLESKVVDELGRETHYKWEEYGDPTPYGPTPLWRQTATDPLGRQTQRYMHPRTRDLEMLRIEPNGARMRNTYDADEGRFVVKLEDMSEPTWWGGYPADFRTKAQYTYEPVFKHLATSTDLGRHTTSYEYTEKGQLASTTDPVGNTTALSYDTQGRLIAVTDGEGAVTRYEYEARGNRAKTIDPLNRETAMSYDLAGNMTSLTDAAGKVTRWEYDQMGRVTKVIDPAGGQTSYIYEAGPCSSGCGGGASNLLKSITDPAGRTTSFEYDTEGRMTAVVNRLGIRKEYSYDLVGRLTRFKNGRGQEITYEYDIANRLVRKTLPDEGPVEYSYDVNNQVTQVTDADSILRYEYVANADYGLRGMKRFERFGLKDDPRYQKQASGVIEYKADGSGSFNFELVTRIHMTTDVDLPYEDNRQTEVFAEYDMDHHPTRLWNDSGQVTVLARISYDRAGRRSQLLVDRPGNVTVNYHYDAAGELLRLEQGYNFGTSEETHMDYEYAYDTVGNRTAVTESAGTHAFAYDDRYQLIAATHPALPAETFSYDPVGNRTSSHLSPTYTYNTANQLLEDAEFIYTYDADGNCTSKVAKTDATRHEYIFNSENRMTGYLKYDGAGTLLTTASYFYDPIGRRIAKEVNGALTRYIYHEEDIWKEITPSGTVVTYFHGPGIDEPLAAYVGKWWSGHQWWSYFVDALGSIRHVRGADAYGGTGIHTASFSYDSFGQSTDLLPFGIPTVQYGFTGREYDPESGLLFLRARYLDPHAGRFTVEDPISSEPNMSSYRYARNRPTLLADAFGMEAGVAGPSGKEIRIECEYKPCPYSQIHVGISPSFCKDETWNSFHSDSDCWRQMGGGYHICYPKNDPSTCRVHRDKVNPCCKRDKDGKCDGCFGIDTLDHAYDDYLGVDFKRTPCSGAPPNFPN